MQGYKCTHMYIYVYIYIGTALAMAWTREQETGQLTVDRARQDTTGQDKGRTFPFS